MCGLAKLCNAMCTTSTHNQGLPLPKMDTDQLLMLLSALVGLALNAYFLWYVTWLEDRCSCALGWRRSFLEFGYVTMLLVGLAMLLIGSFIRESPLGVFLIFGASMIGLAMLFVVRSFIGKMRRTGCDCARTVAFRVLDVVNWIQFALLAFSIMLILLLSAEIAASREARLTAGKTAAGRASAARRVK